MAESQEFPEDMSRQKWWQIPSALTVDLAQVGSINTLKLVLFIARQTFGWGVRSAIMSYDEMRHGRSYAPGKRMKDVSGLRNDQAIVDAIRDALERGLIEVQQTTEGMAYRIPDRYWNEAELVPSKGEFWRYSPSWAVYVHGSAQENRADWSSATANTNGSAQKRRADEREKLSTAIGNPEHSHKKNLAQPLRERAPDVAPPTLLDTSLNTSELDTPDRYVGPSAALQAPPSVSPSKKEDADEPTSADALGAESDSPLQVSAPLGKGKRLPAKEELAARTAPLEKAMERSEAREGNEQGNRQRTEPLESPQTQATGKRSTDGTGTQDVDALAQRFADVQILQSLLAELQHLQTLQPGQSGWGAAQRRLRAIAPEIARLQALSARQSEAISDPERAPSASGAALTEEWRSRATHRQRVGDPPASEAADPEQITRRQRLLQLQSELAQLKKTPSMQLLGRKRIPHLETAIKQLIAEIEASA